MNEIKFDYSHCQSPTLTRLDCGFDGGISSIKKLEKISFTNCNFDYSGLKPPIYHHNCVKRLEFQNCKLSEEFLALLSNSYPLPPSINFHDRWQTFYGSRRSKIYLPNTHVDSINLVEEIDDDGRRKSLNRKHNEMLLTVECGSKAKYYYHLFHLDSGALSNKLIGKHSLICPRLLILLISVLYINNCSIVVLDSGGKRISKGNIDIPTEA